MRAGLGILYDTEGVRYEPKYVVPFISFCKLHSKSQRLDAAFIYEVFTDTLITLTYFMNLGGRYLTRNMFATISSYKKFDKS